jgi:hypothetical protein
MSDIRLSDIRLAADDTPHDLDELAEKNPAADGAQIREAQELLRELRRDGVTRPSYNIQSPYERRPVRKPESVDDRRE